MPGYDKKIILEKRQFLGQKFYEAVGSRPTVTMMVFNKQLHCNGDHRARIVPVGRAVGCDTRRIS